MGERVEQVKTVCERCHGVGWVYATDGEGNVIWRSSQHGAEPKLARCSCKTAVDKERQRVKLEALDGLTEIERARSFARMRPHPSQHSVYNAMVAAENGMITLQGPPGTGKSHLIQCAVNAAREAGRVAVYSTMTDVLDYLRRAFSPGVEPFEERWQLLLSADVLALDELDEFNVTSWANERFLRLIDERWRNQHRQLTIVAMNGDLEDLHPKVASRLAQGQVFHLSGIDMRRIIRP